MEKFSIETEGGEKVYKDDRGDKIGTYTETVREIMSLKLEPLHDFLNMIPEEDEAQRMMYIVKALLEGAEKYIYEAIDYIENNYGEVEIVKAMYRQRVTAETMLDIKFTPPKII